MSPAKILVILVGLAAAIGAVIMARSVLSDNAGATTQPIILAPQVEVVEVDVLIAVRNLKVGETLSFDDLAWGSWPEEKVSPNQITKDMQPEAIDDVSGSIVRIPIFEQEPILPQKIVARGDTGIMAALVSPGMRAVSLEISAETAAGGFILPDDRVDVILTHEVEVTTANGVEDFIQSLVILENVRVLAIDQGASADEDSATALGATATLELSPEDSALIALGEQKGIMSLALRSLTDAALNGAEVTSNAEEIITTAASSGGVRVFRNGQASASSSGGGE